MAAIAPSRAPAQPAPWATRVAAGLDQPVFATAPPTDPRLFLVERAGKIKILDGGSVLPTPFLDITSLVNTSDAFGLFGLAFAPDYATSGLFYVYYMNHADESVIARYAVGVDPDVADPGSGETVLSVAQPGSDHNGGTIAFSPVDGYLYLALGDGGTGPYDPLDNAQDPQQLLGKVLRLDVSGGAGTPYSVPPDNPYVGDASTLDEIWAFGLRNPFRFAFDRLNGNLWIGDVGQEVREEVNRQPAGEGGHNYGWDVMEGTVCNGIDPWPPPPACNAPELTLPFHEYGHDESSPACSGNVIGGHVYRGSAAPDYQGLYFFADFCTGKIWTLDEDTHVLVELTGDLSPAATGQTIDLIVGFGEDTSGELYLVDMGGEVFRIHLPPAAVPGPGILVLPFLVGAAGLLGARRAARSARR